VEKQRVGFIFFVEEPKGKVEEAIEESVA